MPSSPEDLRRENAELRQRLEEAEDALRALKAGEADAVLVEAGHDEVFTLQPASAAYRLLVEQRPHAVATITLEGVILSCNQRFADLLGEPLSALIGRSVEDAVEPSSRPVFAHLRQAGLEREVEGEVVLVREDGACVRASLGLSALKEGAFGTCLMITDLTEQRHYQRLQATQEALRTSEERLDLAQRAGRVGTFEWDLRSGAVRWSSTNEALYGLPAGGFGGSYDDWLRLVHEDDREHVESETRRAVTAGGDIDLECRIVTPAGELHWIATRAQVFHADDGEPLRMVGVSLDVTERRTFEEMLLEADRKKDRFLATLAHELRNPLAPMRNAVGVLDALSSPRAEARWALGVLDRQVRVMARLLEDLLDVSRISRDTLELRLEWITLAAVLDSALETSRPALDAARHEVTFALPDEPLVLRADPVRLAQVFANLLNNAAKYTPPGGHVRVTADARDGEVLVSVEDDGIGMAADVLPHVFELFSQDGSAHERSQGGLGIGLSLVKGVVELHGGSIEAHSAGPGRGSRFDVRLPLAPAERRTSPAARRPRAAASPRRWRILVVDDNHDSAESLARLLSLLGHEVATAHDGRRAVADARALRPDVVLLDIGMPGLDGYQTCRRIRSEPWGRRIVVVALTGWGQAQDRLRSAEAGFDRHLVKPVDLPQLMEVLESLSLSADSRQEAGSDASA